MRGLMAEHPAAEHVVRMRPDQGGRRFQRPRRCGRKAHRRATHAARPVLEIVHDLARPPIHPMGVDMRRLHGEDRHAVALASGLEFGADHTRSGPRYSGAWPQTGASVDASRTAAKTLQIVEPQAHHAI